MKSTKLFSLYYTLLAIILAASVVQTVYEGSRHIAYGRKMATLETQKKALISQQAQLQNQLAQEVSLASVTNFTKNEGFIAVHQPVAITDQTNIVASR